MTSARAAAVLSRFERAGDGAGAVRPLGSGNINDTYLVTWAAGPPVVLQRLNGSVFPRPEQVAANVAAVANHLHRAAAAGPHGCRSYEFPAPVPAVDGAYWVRDGYGDVWRALSYVAGTARPRKLDGVEAAYRAGRLLGCFHRLLEDFDASLLADPLPGFHHLPGYVDSFRRAVAGSRLSPSAELDRCLAMAEARRDMTPPDELARSLGLQRRVIHGDPKRDNFLFRADTGAALSLIDLDTAGAGFVVIDLGDCLRSFSSPAGEHEPESTRFDVDTCRSLLAGYETSAALSRQERTLIYPSVRALTFELGLRFLTDHLDGDRYFKVSYRGENLIKALTQFTLLASIESREMEINRVAAGA